MVKKKNRKVIGIVGVILALSLLFFATSGEFFTTTGSYKCSGGQVLSIDDAKIYTSSDLGGKKVIRVTFSTLPSSECLYINLNPSIINDKLSSSDKQQFQATNTILGDIRLTNEQKVYNINERSSEKFRKIGLSTKSFGFPKICTDSSCRDIYPTTFSSPIWESLSENDYCYCAYDSETGINGEFSVSESFRWNAVIDIGGQSLDMNQNTLSGKVGDIAFVKWSGNLLSNDNLGSITGRQAYKPYSDNQWKMIDYGTQSDLNNKYISHRQSLINCDGIVSGCKSEIESSMGFNSEFDSKTSSKLSTWISGNSIVEGAVIYNNQMIVDLKSAVVYPTFTLDIDAESVGIFISQGQPQVTCPSNIPKIISGQTYDAQISVKNIGSESGSFTYYLICNKGSQSIQPSPPQTISTGATKSLTSRLGLTVQEGIDTSSCVFTARDINSLKEDSCSFSYQSEHQSQCTLGTKSCELGNTQLWTCKSDGGYDKQNCNYGCEAFESSFRCILQAKEICNDGIDNDGNGLIDKDDPQCQIGKCAWYDIPCKLKGIFAGISSFFDVIKYILVAVGSIFSLMFSKNILERIIKKKDKISIYSIWTIAILLGGLTGYILFTILFSWYFWLILIGLIVLNFFITLVPLPKIRRRK